MFHPVSLFIGLRYLRGRSGDRFGRFVSFMSTAGITIGVMSLVTVLSVMNGFENQLKGRMLGVLPQAVVSLEGGKTSTTGGVPDFISALTPYQAQPIARSEAVIQSSEGLGVAMMVGIESDSENPVAQHLITGHMSHLNAGEYGVLVGHSLARELNVSMGDKVRLMVTSASQFTPLGRIPSQRNFTVVGLFNTGSDIDKQLVITNLEDATRLMRLPKETVSGWRLYFDDPFIVSDLSQQALPDGWVWSDWREQRGELFQAVKMEKNMMGLMLGLIVGVAAFNIISALIMVVMEKQSEVAILKTQGMTSAKIMAIFMVQGASSGIVGAVVGGGLGVILAQNVNPLMQMLGVELFTLGGSLPVLIQPLQIISVILLAIALSLLATVYPSYRASSEKPAEALRYE